MYVYECMYRVVITNNKVCNVRKRERKRERERGRKRKRERKREREAKKPNIHT